MEDTIKNSLLALVSKFTSHKLESITEITCLYHDLSISGDDAEELMQEIHTKFGTVFDGLNFGEYFPSETDAIWSRIAKLFGSVSKLKRLTFGHLLNVVRAGHWTAV